MTWFTGTVVYILIWWISLFVVLPVGTKPVAGADATSGWRGAPTHPHLLRKLIATTVLAAVIWTGCYLLIRSDWISFRTGWFALPTD